MATHIHIHRGKAKDSNAPKHDPNRLRDNIKELEGDIRRLRPSDPHIAKLRAEIAEIEAEIKKGSSNDTTYEGKIKALARDLSKGIADDKIMQKYIDYCRAKRLDMNYNSANAFISSLRSNVARYLD